MIGRMQTSWDCFITLYRPVKEPWKNPTFNQGINRKQRKQDRWHTIKAETQPKKSTDDGANRQIVAPHIHPFQHISSSQSRNDQKAEESLLIAADLVIYFSRMHCRVESYAGANKSFKYLKTCGPLGAYLIGWGGRGWCGQQQQQKPWTKASFAYEIVKTNAMDFTAKAFTAEHRPPVVNTRKWVVGLCILEGLRSIESKHGGKLCKQQWNGPLYSEVKTGFKLLYCIFR